jgi:hypothetical protein
MFTNRFRATGVLVVALLRLPPLQAQSATASAGGLVLWHVQD